MGVRGPYAGGHPMPGSFTSWGGGDGLPVGIARYTVVDVWFRMGRSSVAPRQAHFWNWPHTGGTGDIIGWREHSPAENGASSPSEASAGNPATDEHS